MNTITPSALRHDLDEGSRFQLVDVRSLGEFHAGHVPGAVNIPLEELETRLDDLSKTDPIVLICQSGDRACMGQELLASHAPDAIVLQDGTSGWEAAGNPVVHQTRTKWAIERQVRLAAGLLVLSGSLLAVFAAPGWVYLPMAIGAGLTFAGLTNICGMALLFGKMPWNKPVSQRPASGLDRRGGEA